MLLDIKPIPKEYLSSKEVFNECVIKTPNKISENTFINILNKNSIPQKPKTIIGDQFFRFELDGNDVITASLTSDGRIRVYVGYVGSNYLPNKVMIGTLSDDGNTVIQDTTIHRSEKARSTLKHGNWPECLAALNKAATVASVILM